MSITAVEVRITGRVQGVFFRARTYEQAQRLGVSGWVSNEPDGSVAGRFEGEEDAVAALVDWCRQGPPYARVEHVTVTEVAPTGARGFDVRG
jgi:acylphosphatase